MLAERCFPVHSNTKMRLNECRNEKRKINDVYFLSDILPNLQRHKKSGQSVQTARKEFR
jgi:hypothetical protein